MDGATWLVCPRCRGALEAGEPHWRCTGCAARYRTLRGIPDLRTADDIYLSNRDDWLFAEQLDEAFDRLDFRGLLERYFEIAGEIPPLLRARQVAHIMTAPARARHWLQALGPNAGDGAVLDLGCGSGSFLAAVGREGLPLVGLDVAMRWLLVARKRLEEEGLAHLPLVCACSEQMPLADASMAGVVAGDVIEHVADQPATLAEAYRVLATGGRLVMATPNRFSLAPEPHVGVWGVGFLPRRLMCRYVRLFKNVDFRAIRTLGLGECRRLLRQSPFGGGVVRAPALPDGDFATFRPLKRALGRVYNRLVAQPAGQALALRVGPLFHVVCTRGGDQDETGSRGRAASPATRRPTRPQATQA